ncbi:alpha/beta-hydrolase family protein [Glutamicibacter sp. MNS18]|uniref:alpha/beta-hydrolase family protein n=1 Tax=Glutamicibacter sp. MNS18 TaxID=2989817 RepID=UPI002236B2CB|nr:alpha/beta-hydrolase family protein [Glutamicibacter sp. MNS18]MCW4467308.1 alpha/beta-hydrolase family protein [Glutamicibacter sp. MNS18]
MSALLTLTPSLLPRTALFQGVLCAVAAILGYGAGVLVSWLIETARKEHEPVRRRARTPLVLVFALLLGIGLWLYQRWQRQQRDALGMDGQPFWQVLLVPLLGLVLFGALLVICRIIHRSGQWLIAKLGRIVPPRVAVVVAVLVLAMGLSSVMDRTLIQRVAGTLDNIYLGVNDEFLNELQKPLVSEVSAGPGSLSSWEQLGRQGRLFVNNTPQREEISQFTGTQAQQPIRVYIGAGSDGEVDLREQAYQAVEELERTGAFERQVLNVATGTGRGWVNENQIQAMEYMWGGDTATASIQYSYLPSWMSFLVDSTRARDAGRLLFDAVYQRWAQLPHEQRPLLVVSGESLGSFGAEAAFSGAQDFASRTDGALFVGPAANNQLWGQLTTERDAGSPQHLPVYQEGEHVRFSDDGVRWPGQGDWEGTRIGYLQHANDPISWGHASVLTQRPDWLRNGQRPDEIPRQMIWVPVITGLQLVLDQVAPGVPDGQGHEFGQVPVRAWAQILPPEEWNQDDTERLVRLLSTSQPAR